MTQWQIGIIGFGEVGGIFARALAEHPSVEAVRTWDIRFDTDPAAADAVPVPVHASPGLAAMCDGSMLLISAVTAANTLPAAEAAARVLRPGTLYLDLNSASPATKRQAAQRVVAAGGRYVDAGVMTSVPPHGLGVPMVMSGPDAAAIAEPLRALGMNVKAVSDAVGTASAIKMSRSIMIKGLEALVVESYVNARRYGVEAHMLPTLAETFPGIDWPAVGAYFFSRVARHGKRRAEEMAECARTVAEGGVEPLMAAAVARKMAWIAGLSGDGVFDGLSADDGWPAYADRIIAEIGQTDPSPPATDP